MASISRDWKIEIRSNFISATFHRRGENSINIHQCIDHTEPAGAVSCGSLASLVPGSRNISNLPYINNIRNENVKWFVIVSDRQDITGGNSLLRQFLNYLLAGMTPVGQVPSSICSAGSNLTMLCLIGGDRNNDVIVTTTSQSDNSGGNLAEYSNVAHSPVPAVVHLIPGLRSLSNVAITDGTADPCIEAILRTWTMSSPCPSAGSPATTQFEPAGDLAQQTEPKILTVPGESQEDANARSAYPETLHPERISIKTPAESVPLGNPVHLTLTIEKSKINSILYSQSLGSSELDFGVAKIVQDEGTTKIIEVVPLQLGPLDVWVMALYGDNAAADQTIRLNVVPSSVGLTKFDLDEGVHSMRLILGSEEWQSEHWLEPVVTYDGAKYPIRLKDSSQIALLIEQDASNPVISIDKYGMVHALRAGNAVVIGEYAGVRDEVRVTVESR